MDSIMLFWPVHSTANYEKYFHLLEDIIGNRRVPPLYRFVQFVIVYLATKHVAFFLPIGLPLDMRLYLFDLFHILNVTAEFNIISVLVLAYHYHLLRQLITNVDGTNRNHLEVLRQILFNRFDQSNRELARLRVKLIFADKLMSTSFIMPAIFLSTFYHLWPFTSGIVHTWSLGQMMAFYVNALLYDIAIMVLAFLYKLSLIVLVTYVEYLGIAFDANGQMLKVYQNVHMSHRLVRRWMSKKRRQSVVLRLFGDLADFKQKHEHLLRCVLSYNTVVGCQMVGMFLGEFINAYFLNAILLGRIPWTQILLLLDLMIFQWMHIFYVHWYVGRLPMRIHRPVNQLYSIDARWQLLVDTTTPSHRRQHLQLHSHISALNTTNRYGITYWMFSLITKYSLLAFSLFFIELITYTYALNKLAIAHTK